MVNKDIPANTYSDSNEQNQDPDLQMTDSDALASASTNDSPGETCSNLSEQIDESDIQVTLTDVQIGQLLYDNSVASAVTIDILVLF